MKRVLKIIIPIVIIVALLAASIWFFFFSRPDLTNNFLISKAQKMTENERYSRAIRYYGWASALEPERNDIAVMLADTYMSCGNYTKAEYTLVNAISEHPNAVELYAALCNVYVKQSKFLDATQMLDRTTDPTVKQALDSLRPKAPLVSPEGGSYHEYIDVSATSDAEAVYLTTNGSYPSSQQDLYREPFTLPGGETTIIAVAVDENGLVSPVVRVGYTIGGVVEPVTLSDPAIDQTVREQLHLNDDDVLMSDMLWSITSLTLPNTVKDLSDLSLFISLRSLTIQEVSGLDFTVLMQTPSLQELNLSGCTIPAPAIESIASLTELEKLILDGCALTDISKFSNLTKMKELCISNNSVSDLGAVSSMTQLESLTVSNNPISTTAPLSSCVNLKYLDISNCSVSSIENLRNLTQLETLLASNNNISKIDHLDACKTLSVVELNSNQVSDISVLASLPSLTRFEADHNTITGVPDFEEDNCILVYISLNYNKVEDISGLAGIDSLNYLNIDYNKVKNLSPIAENINLIKVNAWDNPLSEDGINALTQHEIIVNYNPQYSGDEN